MSNVEEGGVNAKTIWTWVIVMWIVNNRWAIGCTYKLLITRGVCMDVCGFGFRWICFREHKTLNSPHTASECLAYKHTYIHAPSVYAIKPDRRKQKTQTKMRFCQRTKNEAWPLTVASMGYDMMLMTGPQKISDHNTFGARQRMPADERRRCEEGRDGEGRCGADGQTQKAFNAK